MLILLFEKEAIDSEIKRIIENNS